MGLAKPIEVTPQGDDSSVAKQALMALKDAENVRGHRVIARLELSENILVGLTGMLVKIAAGEQCSILSTNRDYTTREAANILRFSQGHLYKLLDSGEIPFRKVGKHRRIDAKDLLAYQIKLEQERRSNFAEMARLGQSLDND